MCPEPVSMCPEPVPMCPELVEGRTPRRFHKLKANPRKDVVAAAVASRWRPVRPGVVPISERQRRPYLARSKALSALPAWSSRLLRQLPDRASGWVVTRSPQVMPYPLRTVLKAKSESSRKARGNRSSKPPVSTSAARRYAISAVIQGAPLRPNVRRSASVGRRPSGAGT